MDEVHFMTSSITIKKTHLYCKKCQVHWLINHKNEASVWHAETKSAFQKMGLGPARSASSSFSGSPIVIKTSKFIQNVELHTLFYTRRKKHAKNLTKTKTANKYKSMQMAKFGHLKFTHGCFDQVGQIAQKATRHSESARWSKSPYRPDHHQKWWAWNMKQHTDEMLGNKWNLEKRNYKVNYIWNS